MKNTESPDPEFDRQSQLQLSHLLDTVAVGIFCVNQLSECTYCNATSLEMLRFESAEQLIGQDMHELIHHTRRDGCPFPQQDCRISKALATQQKIHVNDDLFFRSDGSKFEVEYWVRPLQENGRTIGSVISFLDISARRENAANRNHLARLVEFSNDAIVSKNKNGVITSWNSGAEQIFGFTAKEAIGQTSAELILPSDINDEEPEILEALRTGTELRQFEVKRKRKNGENCDISLTISPIFNNDGENIGASFVERDITENRRARDELIRAKTAAEHAETLANVANRSRSEFLATVSHELRTPMNAILGMLTLALDEKLDPTIQDYLKTAKSSADSLLTLVNEILDFSKIESGTFEIIHQPFGLREIMNQAAKSMGPRASEKRIELLCEIDNDLPDSLVGDGLRIQQVITNLLSNAVKFTERGEILLTAIKLRQFANDVRIEFSVSDTGIGIRPEDRERIFSPFAQADMSLTRKQYGTGLGLSICRELLLLMGGTLQLESEFGTGSRFSFELTLPIADDRQPTDEMPKDLLENIQVLVVDDNATNLRILEKTLVNWSMQPIVAESAEQALRIFDELEATGRKISIAIIDAMMPDTDGFALANKIAERQPETQLPIIIMRSSTDVTLFARQKPAATVAGYLNKPVSQSELLDTVVDKLNFYDRDSAAKQNTERDTPQANRPLTILLAEDLPANQKVVRAILQKRGHRVLIASDGRSAIEQLERGEAAIDLVLMDVQMPVMDGFEATQAIRQLAGPQSQLPIVAMTAHAMRGDREACLAAGMDAYLSKPIDAEKLLELVETSVHGMVHSQVQTEQPTFVRESDDLPKTTDVELELVEMEAAVRRLGGDQQLFREFVEIFMQDAPPLMDKIETAMATSNHQQLEKSAHALKGLMLNFGAQPCVELALRFEQAGRSAKLKAVVHELDQLKSYFEKLQNELEPFIR